MKTNLLKALSLVLGAVIFSGCATDPSTGSNSGVLVEDGNYNGGYIQQGEVQTGLDPDGSITVSNDYDASNSGFTGPQNLRDNNTVYFKYDSDQILDDYIVVMQSHAQYLRDNPDSRIIIEGHTDERGTPEYNIALGERRARSVAQYMQNLGVDINQLSIVSYGEEKPAIMGHDENAWSKNRRAVINY